MNDYNATKPHYHILDGLRGVAALMVMWFHIFEGFASSPIDQRVNHGYLAVDFFFVLSGFVIGYAYDNRWQKGMGLWQFFRRRLVRLHPMVVVGAILGVVAFLIQGSVQWDGTRVATSAAMLAMLMTLFLIPSAPGSATEVRGNGEMFPLNGPMWSLFFEYVGNVLYALLLRRLSTKALTVVAVFCGAALAALAFANTTGTYSLGGGWSFLNGDPAEEGLFAYCNFALGFMRMAFPYTVGLLMARVFRPRRQIKGAFWLCGAIIVVVTSLPYMGSGDGSWTNALYDLASVIVLFPALVWIGASGVCSGRISERICNFLGDLSYPLYVVQYPVMYLFYAWLWNNGRPSFGEVWQVALCVYVGNIVLAYVAMRFYDAPVRRWLKK